MNSPDFRPCPFCAHAEPIVVTIAGLQPAYVIACAECGATGPKQLPGVPVEAAPPRYYSVHALDGNNSVELAPQLHGLERFLAQLFLRRYVTWYARRRRFAQMQGSARLFAEC